MVNKGMTIGFPDFLPTVVMMQMGFPSKLPSDLRPNLLNSNLCKKYHNGLYNFVSVHF